MFNIKKRQLKIFILFLCFNLVLLPNVGYAHVGPHFDFLSGHPIGAPAETATTATDPTTEKKTDLKDKIKELEKNIAELQNKEKSLQNQINSINNQINLIQLKIQTANTDIKEAEEELVAVTSDIGVVSGKISKLADAMQYQSMLLNERIKARYKSEMVSPVEMVFSSDLSGLVRKVRYIKAVQEQDNKLINQMKGTKTNYEGQKLSLEEKKTKTEQLKAKIESDKRSLESYKVTLANQKSEKDSLLSQTEGQEAKYQDLLNKAKAELNAIENAVSDVRFANGTKVKKGDAIAIMGNSGAPYCSTGAHLHFEVRKNGAVVNAENYVKGTSIFTYDYVSGYKTIGSGSWDWPMKSPQITQRYGKTPWSWRYGDGRHSGIDMVASNTQIYAPADGTFVRGVVRCYGVGMNYAAIDHGGGVVSYYFHIR